MYCKLQAAFRPKMKSNSRTENLQLIFPVQEIGILWVRTMGRWWRFSRIFQSPQSTAGNNPKPIFRAIPSPGAALPHWEQCFCVSPTKIFPAVSPGVLSHPYPEVKAPGRSFFPWIFCKQPQKQDASPELSLCHALVTHSLHRSCSRDTNPKTKPQICKGHEGEAGGLEKKGSNIWNYYQEQQKLLLHAADYISQLIKITQGDFIIN